MNKKLKPVETEKEFYDWLEIYRLRLKKFRNNVKQFYSNPKEAIKEFESIMEEMVYLKLIPLDYANRKRKVLYRELNVPTEFNTWLREHIEKIKQKFSKEK